jgi:CRP-like cAMP-binding protein
MKNLVFDFFKEYRFLQLADLLDIYQVTSLKSYKAGEVIARQGQQFEYSIGIRQGIIRTYILTSDGSEKTVRFAKEGEFTGCMRSILYGQASNEFLEVVEDAKVILLSTEKLKLLASDNIRLLKLWNQAVSTALHDAILRIEFFTSLSAEERYIHLLKENPELIRRVPQKYLASYIGVTTVSLSRIRSRVTTKFE